MEVNLLSSSDRNNYGDLLFPLILKKYIETTQIDCTLNNFGIIKSDLSYFKALPTLSYSDLLKEISSNNNDCKIVIAGGEVLGGKWLNILRYVSPFWNFVNKSYIISKIINRTSFLEWYYYVFKKSSRPFILDHKFFNRSKIFYNSVGAIAIGSLLRNKSWYRSYFTRVQKVSLRDTLSYSYFEDGNLNAQLVPDSALIMSDLFEEEIECNMSASARDLKDESYAFVQLGYSKGPEDLKGFSNMLLKFSRRKNVKIVLCPIGLALDHSDPKILKELAALQPDFQYVEPSNLFDIMGLIKYSKLFIGTSLHGIITAQSFNVPSIAFTEKIKKLEYYIKTWFITPDDIVSEFTDLDKIINRMDNFDENQEFNSLSKQKAMIYNNLSSFFND